MMEENVQNRDDAATNVGRMVAWQFVEASKTDDFYQTSVEGLVKLADSLFADNDQMSLNVVIGALAQMKYTYHRPGGASA